MKLSSNAQNPVYTIAGASTARPLPEWLARRRKRSLKNDPEYANRIELLQDFEFEEASQCVRVSEDGEWVMSTGTYKPQIHTHYLPHLSLSYARHTNTINEKFVLLGSDYSKSLHLQTDRTLEFHTPGGLHYTARIPRYGRDILFSKRNAEALIPAVGVNADGNGEVFRLNLELGRFMRGYEVDVGGDDLTSLGGGALQGGINTGAVNTAAIAEESHGLMAFGTSIGTVEFWDARSRNRVSVLGPSSSAMSLSDGERRPEVTALSFHSSGLQLATGSSDGLVHLYDLRSPVPLLRKDQGYDFPIQTLQYLPANNQHDDLVLSSDKRIIKLWSAQTGEPFTSVEPVVDLHHVELVSNSGMLLTANEGRQQHAFFMPSLGPAPKWCSFLDNLVEEMAEDAADPNAFDATAGNLGQRGEVYDNFKFLGQAQLRQLNLDHLIGKTNLLRPYMHGYFVAQKLYEQAKLISQPDLLADSRRKTVQDKIDRERESRIRGNKKVSVKVNRRLAERLQAREEANERRKAQRVLKQGGDEAQHAVAEPALEQFEPAADREAPEKSKRLLGDDRFRSLFENEDFEIDETSREFALQNPSTVPNAEPSINGRKRGLTAAEEIEAQDVPNSSGDDDQVDDDDEEAEQAALQARRQQRSRSEHDRNDSNRIGSSNYQKSGHRSQRPQQRDRGPRMEVRSTNPHSNGKVQRQKQSKSFGDLASSSSSRPRQRQNGNGSGAYGGAVGEKEVTFAPAVKKKFEKRPQFDASENGRSNGRAGGKGGFEKKERRSASGNTFRRM